MSVGAVTRSPLPPEERFVEVKPNNLRHVDAQIGCETVALGRKRLGFLQNGRDSDAQDSPTKRIHQDQMVS